MKTIEESRARLRGLFNITMTPFKADQSIDFEGLSRNALRVLDLGFDGLLIGGTYGEFPTLSVEERAEIFRHVMNTVDDRAPVMLCTAHSDPRVVRELTTLAGELGGVPMVMPPYVSEVTDDQIVAFFLEMAPLSKTGAIVYNAPGTGITLSPSVLEKLSDIPQMVAIKQGDLSPGVIDRIAGRLKGKIGLFCASDLAFLGPMAAGFDGISSTNSGAFPELVQESYRAIEGGDSITAGALHRRWYDYRAFARQFGQPQTVKAAMNLRGFDGGHVRAPLRDLGAAEIGVLEALVRPLAG
ncbi:dihydrodipicolinate synthase family protein [Tanticharoenia sakaeratensis]|uniref:Dihydrodipicolinate synthetase n=1 Tax=Tanticharoenia sakaeratensis NBRC 103193 TaxID=1231623 RepID=A0A0D6ML15_9PROT|nr:dihydrodipicolinate synthase family protein [Tanticharoenia sakaeratensis]GAN53968.1 dihydrodipicolinate synthetase [Tanticharoenia sakaeratensis NBRC 103193]GBQ23550.1 dihydrodipicolinate synthase [Tanticharoenia sakaeratensis NBRC 103193]